MNKKLALLLLTVGLGQPKADVGSIVFVPKQDLKRQVPKVRFYTAPPESISCVDAARNRFVWPTGDNDVSSPFMGPRRRHDGIDIAGKMRSPIYSTRSGVVEVSTCNKTNGYGCYVVINHGRGVRSLYAHNSKLLVRVGDPIRAGQMIALMGKTGRVRGKTGIHSHFEIEVNGKPVNPLKYKFLQCRDEEEKTVIKAETTPPKHLKKRIRHRGQPHFRTI